MLYHLSYWHCEFRVHYMYIRDSTADTNLYSWQLYELLEEYHGETGKSWSSDSQLAC